METKYIYENCEYTMKDWKVYKNGFYICECTDALALVHVVKAYEKGFKRGKEIGSYSDYDCCLGGFHDG